jgi:hypothetical protein
MQRIQQFLIINDLSIFSLLILFFIGFLAFDYEIFGLNSPFIHLPESYKTYFEVLPAAIFSMLVIDLVIKFKLVGGDLGYFVKKYWIDIVLTILIPVLFPLKFIKPALKIYKSTKFAKSGYKLIQKYDKIFRQAKYLK